MLKTVSVEGICDARFRGVRSAFSENFEKLGDIGASVAVTVEGRPVVDLWAGYADRDRARPWDRDTLVNVYSCTKGVVATCAHILADRGLLDLDAPVARYWPEFVRAGKETLPVRFLLDHRAGLPGVREPLPPGAHADWPVMVDALARTAPWWEPGTRHGYHAMTFGWLVGEVMRRITGKTVGAFLREELAWPLGLDFHIGLSLEDEHRTAEIIPAPPLETGQVNPLTERLRDPSSVTYAAMMNPKNMMVPGMANTREWRMAQIPAANGHSNARSLARLYGVLACGGEIDGHRILGSDTLAAAVAEQCNGTDEVLGIRTRFALGYMLPEGPYSFGPNRNAFGHPGFGGSIGFADPQRGVGFAYTMNQLQGAIDIEDRRWRALVDAVYGALG